MQSGSVEARTQGVGEGVADASARVEQRVRGRAEHRAVKAWQGRNEYGMANQKEKPRSEDSGRA
jgi:hypothetical protein